MLDWELQGHDLPANWAKRVEGSSEFYGGLGFETSVGFQIVSCWIVLKQGVAAVEGRPKLLRAAHQLPACESHCMLSLV